MSKGDWQGNLTGAAKILEKVALPAKRAASETTCAKLAGRMIEFGAQCETVGADASLSAVGRREKWGRLLSDARSTVLEYEALATAVADTIMETKRRAIADWAPPRARDVAVQLENQELRRHAQGLDPLTLKAKYIRAIHQGDVAFVDALENAPKVLGVLSAELFTEGQAVKLDLSPLGPEIEALEAERAALSFMLALAKNELAQFDVRLHERPRRFEVED